MKPCITPRPFELGWVVATRQAHETLSMSDITVGLTRHAGNDWGDVGQCDWEANDVAVQNGERLLSSYRSASGVTFWIITEWNRSVTTVLLPEDY
jgi:glycine cleavage system H lipoate-binding protein